MLVLLVEDDEMLGQGIFAGLEQEGAKVTWVKDGQAALPAIKASPFDVVVLDLGLPKLSGLKVLREWRKEGCLLPILILTARDSVEDRVAGLDTGGDDYLVKPFDMDELLARLRALVRRKGDGSGAAVARVTTTLKHQHLELDIPSHTLLMNGKIISIPRREFILLQKLLENVGKVLSRAQLTQTLYGWDEDIDSNALEVHIHNLRKKLDANFIRTIRGVGYMVDKV